MKIALTFSGGGFRAAAFSLGGLSLLSRIATGKGNLLDHITVLSTVSGGTITGARYALGVRKGEHFKAIYDQLYHFMSNADLVSLALERLAADKDWDEHRTRNLITAFADIYDRDLFGGALFGELMIENPNSLRHISFNATEFTNALQFRFQWSERINQPAPGEAERGMIGNKYYNISPTVAQDIRLADIMAASSCFPGGFEPVNFPDDFVLPPDKRALLGDSGYPVGLMDGGIVDNQGIEPVLLAEQRMKRNVPVGPDGSKPTQTELIIVCEVASPYMDGFQASVQHRGSGWKDISPKGIAFWNSVLLLILVATGIWCFRNDYRVGLMATTVGMTLSGLVFLGYRLAKSLAATAGVPSEFLQPLGKLLKLRLYIYENLIANRFRSVMMLTMNVFLKHVRRLNYNKLYNDKAWLNRRIMNGIYELRPKERWQQKVDTGSLPVDLAPSPAIQKNSQLASSMGTTLWFTKDELEQQKMLDAIIACGQYTLCWNLLEYISQVKKDNTNTTDAHLELLACESQLMVYWRQFQHDPKFLLPR